ncbi:hypothetical protein HY384_03750 [Candidatus Daviesbacteria bacterium]|nr:hypothetical protein [Candidatus Daviesbacteria bacterium]
MNQTEHTPIRHTGPYRKGLTPDQQQRIEVELSKEVISARQQGLADIESTGHLKFFPNKIEEEQMKKVDDLAREYFLNKLATLGIPAERLNIPSIHYVVARFDDIDEVIRPEEAGLYHAGLNTIVIKVKPDMLSTAETVIHEYSHAQVPHKDIWSWDSLHPQQSNPGIKYRFKGRVATTGLSVRTYKKVAGKTERIITGDVLEEGFAHWDKIDLYPELKKIYPFESRLRNDVFSYHQMRDEQAELNEMNRWSLVSVSHQIIYPFIQLWYRSGKKLFPSSSPDDVTISRIKYKGFFLVQRLCRLIGDEVNPALSDKKKIQKGRELLERSRYLHTKNGLKTIVRLLGAERAKIILKADRDEKSIEQAIETLKAVELERQAA